MTNEEIQRTMEFILKSQADSFVQIEGLKEATKGLLEVSRRLVTTTSELVESNHIMKDLLVHQSRRLDRLEGQA